MPLNKAKRKAASNLKNIFGYEELSSGYSVNFLKPNSIINYNAFLQKYVQAYGNFVICSHAYLCVFYYDLRQMPYNKL